MAGMVDWILLFIAVIWFWFVAWAVPGLLLILIYRAVRKRVKKMVEGAGEMGGVKDRKKGPGFRYSEETGKFTCKGCEREFASQGGYNFHDCKGKAAGQETPGQKGGGGNKAPGAGKAGGKDKEVRKDCPSCKSDNRRLLRPSVPKEKEFIGQGYSVVCLDCKEVY